MRLTTWAILLTIAAIPAALADGPQRAVSDRIAIEAVSIFKGSCVDHDGDPAAINAAAEKSEKAIHPMPTDDVVALHQGRTGGVAWSGGTPSGGKVILSLDPIGICAVYVQKVDGLSLHNAVLALLDYLAETGSIRYRKVEDTMSAIRGGDRRYTAYLLSRPSLEENVVFAVSSTNSEKTSFQGFLTYGPTSEPF